MSDYTIKEILGIFDTKYPESKRVAVKTNETGDRSISLFTKFPETLAVGKIITGEVTEKEFNGRTFYNFAFGKKDDRGPAASDGATAEIKNILNLKVVPMLTAIYKHLEINEKPRGYDYPEFNESNDAHNI